jgi:transposase
MVDGQLPPILVHRPTMQVIDGMHRLHAAMLRGEDTIAVEFFDGNEGDAFLRAVQANVEHGLPLTRADREAAVVRIIASHPQLSDRAIATIAGVSAPTVGAIRKRTRNNGSHVTARIGRDGRTRPLNSAEGRRRASEVIRKSPGLSLREIAHEAGISTGTVRDVQQRLHRGEDPVPPGRGGGQRNADTVPNGRTREVPDARSAGPSCAAVIENLRKDPSLRFNKNGRTLLQWLGIHLVGMENLGQFADSLPSHCVKTVADLARSSADMWTQLARQLERRAQDIEQR